MTQQPRHVAGVGQITERWSGTSGTSTTWRSSTSCVIGRTSSHNQARSVTMQAIFGFLGSLVGLIATVIAAAAGITFFIVLWKSGSLPETVGIIGAFVGGSIK